LYNLEQLSAVSLRPVVRRSGPVGVINHTSVVCCCLARQQTDGLLCLVNSNNPDLLDH